MIAPENLSHFHTFTLVTLASQTVPNCSLLSRHVLSAEQTAGHVHQSWCQTADVLHMSQRSSATSQFTLTYKSVTSSCVIEALQSIPNMAGFQGPVPSISRINPGYGKRPLCLIYSCCRHARNAFALGFRLQSDAVAVRPAHLRTCLWHLMACYNTRYALRTC